MKIAIPTENGRLQGHFGGCRQFTLVEVEPHSRATLGTEVLSAPDHQPGLFPRWLGQQGVQTVIAGGIGHRALDHFARAGITVRAGIRDATVEELVAAFIDGRLTASPSGCDHHDHGHEHGHGHAHHHEHHHEHHHHHHPEHRSEASGKGQADDRGPGAHGPLPQHASPHPPG